MQDKEATVAVLTVVAVLAVMAYGGSVVTANPLKLSPPFRHPDSLSPYPFLFLFLIISLSLSISFCFFFSLSVPLTLSAPNRAI